MSALVTAIVAAWNEERHVGACLDSLLRQTYAPLEILVADDGSTDRTAEIARNHSGVRLLTLAHAGKAQALNHAAREARGDILLFLDADLRFEPDYVARLVGPITAGDAVGTSHATEYVANPANLWSRCMQATYALPAHLRLDLTEAQLAEGTTVFRAIGRQQFLAVGGFEDTGYLDDQSLFPKLGRRGMFVREAACHHHNPDRLREVFAAGTWAGKSVHLLHGGRAAVTRIPVRALLRGIAQAWRHRMPPLLVYVLVYETGIWWGVVKRTLGLDRRLGA